MRFSVLVLTLVGLVLTTAQSFGAATVSFKEPVPYDSMVSGANSVAVGDLNGDGYPDFVVATNNGVTVYLNDGAGDGGFVSGTNYSTSGTVSNSVAVADVDGDGFPDIIVTNTCTVPASQGCYGIAVLINDQTGNFPNVVNYDSGGTETGVVLVADLNGDGYPDLILASNCQDFTCAGGTLTELLNNSSHPGTFLAFTTISDVKAPIALGDMNNDGIPDLVTSAGVMLGNGDGTFQSPLPSIVPGAISFALADVNGDGYLDVIAVMATGNKLGQVSVQLGNGDGTLKSSAFFKTGTSIKTGSNPLSVAVADFNGDTKLDLAVLNECTDYGTGGCLNGSTIGVLAGNGDGTFKAPVMFQGGGFTGTSVVAADVTDPGNNTNSLVGKIDLITSVACAGVNPFTCPNDGLAGVLLNNFTVATTTTITTSLSPQILGQPVTFTATVASVGNVSPIPDGSPVTFVDSFGVTTLCTGTTVGGIATCTATFSAVGVHVITATYAGDGLYHTSSFGRLNETVNKYPSTTSVMSSPNPSTSKQQITLTATVTSAEAGGATGYVYFYIGSTSVGHGTVSGGVATYTVTAIQAKNYLTSGTYTINANYHGDNLTATSSGSTTQQVN